MSYETSVFCLTNVEIQVINTLTLYEAVCSEMFADQSALVSLEEKGFIEKIHQDIACIDRYRLTTNGRIKQRQFNHLW